MLDQRYKIQLVDDVNGAISGACAENGADPGTSEHFEKVSQSFLVVAPEDEILFSDGITDFDLEAPAFDQRYGGLDFF